jgi:SulP family sulfate permease
MKRAGSSLKLGKSFKLATLITDQGFMCSFEVSTGMNEEGGFRYNLKTLQFLFRSEHVMGLWMSALFLAVTLRFITEKLHHQLIFPICEFSILIG